MRLQISLMSESPVVVPLTYKSALQAVVYSMLDDLYAAWLHDKGFSYEKRSFKLFVFSGFRERYRFLKKEQSFLFPRNISFYVASPVHEILEQLAKNFAFSAPFDIAGNRVIVESISVLPFDDIETSPVRVNAIEPIEVHSTLMKADGAKMTYFYSPKEADFSRLVAENLKKKWYSFYGSECPYECEIEPVQMRYCRERVQTFKKRVLKGWTGHFWLRGEPEMLAFALDVGLGSSNSAGYGMIEVVK